MSRKIIIEEDKLQEILDAVNSKVNLFYLLTEIISRTKLSIEILPDLMDSNMIYAKVLKDGDEICLTSGLIGYSDRFCENIIADIVRYSLELINKNKNI